MHPHRTLLRDPRGRTSPAPGCPRCRGLPRTPRPGPSTRRRRAGGLRLGVLPDPLQVAAAEEQLKQAQADVEEAILGGHNSATTSISPEELERRRRVLKRSKEELVRHTAELAAQRAELAAQRTTQNKLLDLLKSREERLAPQSQGRAGTTGALGATGVSQSVISHHPDPMACECQYSVVQRMLGPIKPERNYVFTDVSHISLLQHMVGCMLRTWCNHFGHNFSMQPLTTRPFASSVAPLSWESLSILLSCSFVQITWACMMRR